MRDFNSDTMEHDRRKNQFIGEQIPSSSSSETSMESGSTTESDTNDNYNFQPRKLRKRSEKQLLRMKEAAVLSNDWEDDISGTIPSDKSNSENERDLESDQMSSFISDSSNNGSEDVDWCPVQRATKDPPPSNKEKKMRDTSKLESDSSKSKNATTKENSKFKPKAKPKQKRSKISDNATSLSKKKQNRGNSPKKTKKHTTSPPMPINMASKLPECQIDLSPLITARAWKLTDTYALYQGKKLTEIRKLTTPLQVDKESQHHENNPHGLQMFPTPFVVLSTDNKEGGISAELIPSQVFTTNNPNADASNLKLNIPKTLARKFVKQALVWAKEDYFMYPTVTLDQWTTATGDCFAIIPPLTPVPYEELTATTTASLAVEATATAAPKKSAPGSARRNGKYKYRPAYLCGNIL